MPEYSFEIHQRDARSTAVETVSAADDAEARTLAELRLLLSPDFTGVDVFLRSQRKFALSRDSMSGSQGRPPMGTGSPASPHKPRLSPGARPPV